MSEEEYKTVPFSTVNSITNVNPIHEIEEEDEDGHNFNFLSFIELKYCTVCHLE